MTPFTINNNLYLSENITAYYHQDYVGFSKPGNPDFINHLKNTFGNTNADVLNNSMNSLLTIIQQDLTSIAHLYSQTKLTVCVVPRAKQETNYTDNQKLFKTTINNFITSSNLFDNGINYINRVKDTQTTHLAKSRYGGSGDSPYPGISTDTCNFSSQIKNKDILLIDDIYTPTINIDEDMIQALLDNGAKSVIFYCIGKTIEYVN